MPGFVLKSKTLLLGLSFTKYYLVNKFISSITYLHPLITTDILVLVIKEDLVIPFVVFFIGRGKISDRSTFCEIAFKIVHSLDSVNHQKC